MTRGRGADSNPQNRFETFSRELDPEAAQDSSPRTQILRDASRSIISKNDSPDIPFAASLNPYRGCEHGCSYCYARPYHEYLGFSSGLDFETKIVAKFEAATLLRKELSAKKWTPQVLVMSGVTDCYQPVERKLRITRACLEVLNEFKNPVCLITKNALIARDADLLSELSANDAAKALVSVTTLDAALAAKLEPRASTPAARLKAIRELSDAGVPVCVMAAPLIPGLNDHEMPAILKAAFEAGAGEAGYTLLRLPYAVKDVFSAWLEEHVPGQMDKILSRIRNIRGGRLNNPDFGSRMRGSGPHALQIAKLFELSCRKIGLNARRAPLSAAAFRKPRPFSGQLDLFGE